MNRYAMLCSIVFAAHALTGSAQQGQAGVVHITIDTRVNRHPISPLIYGVNSGTTQQLESLRSPLNRSGGDSAEVFNYQADARNSGRDWFFESYPCHAGVLEQYGDGFVALTRRAHASPMLTVPMVGWVAKLGPDRTRLAGYSILKYGLQRATDKSGFAEAGDGVALNGKFIVNDPHDAMQPDSLERETEWMRRNVTRWKPASAGGIPFYLLGNEPSRWHDIHRDVHPVGTHASELLSRTVALANMIHHVDRSAKVMAPEEWAPVGTRDSGFDQQIRETNNGAAPDRTRETGGLDLLPWLLRRWKAAGHPVDIVSVHYYPQGGEYGDDVSERVQLLRNRSTRALWDASFHDIEWMPVNTALIPSLRSTVDQNYVPGTPIALTEYSWGAEHHMSGATAQADLLGIFGRENLYAATRWIAPAEDSPVFLVMKLFRNYDDRGGSFGETSVAARVADPELVGNPDRVSAFAAVRETDRALTVMLINKQLRETAKAVIEIEEFNAQGSFESVQLVEGKLVSQPAHPFHNGAVDIILPAQSVTLLIFHAS